MHIKNMAKTPRKWAFLAVPCGVVTDVTAALSGVLPATIEGVKVAPSFSGSHDLRGTQAFPGTAGRLVGSPLD
jgi:hypothetical protein